MLPQIVERSTTAIICPDCKEIWTYLGGKKSIGGWIGQICPKCYSVWMEKKFGPNWKTPEVAELLKKYAK